MNDMRYDENTATLACQARWYYYDIINVQCNYITCDVPIRSCMCKVIRETNLVDYNTYYIYKYIYYIVTHCTLDKALCFNRHYYF